MKCRNCSVEVSPIFASALVQNKCPACGKEIMSGKEFKEMLRFRGLLSGLQLDDKLIITIAAALSTKFDLVPKATDGYGEIITNITLPEKLPMDDQSIRERALQAALQSTNKQRKPAFKPGFSRTAQREIPEEDTDTPEAQQAIRDWGLENGQEAVFNGKPSRNKTPPPQELVALFENSGPPDISNLESDPFANRQLEADRLARLAKSDAARSDSGTFKVRRSGYNYDE